MNDKNDELRKIINNMLENSNELNTVNFENNILAAEEVIGKEIDRKDEQADDQKLAYAFVKEVLMAMKIPLNLIEQVLEAIEDKININMMFAHGQLLTRVDHEYQVSKTKYMKDTITFLIDYLKGEVKNTTMTTRTTDVKKFLEPKDEIDDASARPK